MIDGCPTNLKAPKHKARKKRDQPVCSFLCLDRTLECANSLSVYTLLGNSTVLRCLWLQRKTENLSPFENFLISSTVGCFFC